MNEENSGKRECSKKAQINVNTNYLDLSNTLDFIDSKIKQRSVMIFAKTYSPECKIALKIFQKQGIIKNFEVFHL